MAHLLLPSLFTAGTTASTVATAGMVAGGTLGVMGAAGAFKKPPAVQTPDIPEPTPQLETQTLEQARAEAQRRARGRRGKRQTVVTGELEPMTTKKTLLG